MDISAKDFKRISDARHCIVIDVREKLEFHTYNIGGTNIPLGIIETITDHNFNKNDEIIVICMKGIRSKTACLILRSLGYQNVRNLKGGLTALRRLNEF